MKQPSQSRTEPAGVRLCGAAAALLGFGETMLRGESRCWARNTPPGTFDMFHKHTESRTGWRTAGSLGLGGLWVMAGAAVLQIWGHRCGRVYGFLGTYNPKSLGTFETLFATKQCQKLCPWGSLPCGHTRRSRNEALPFFCGLFL